MSSTWPRSVIRSRRAVAIAAVAASAGAVLLNTATSAVATPRTGLIPGDLLVSRLHYTSTAGMIVKGQTVLPTGVTAVADGAFPEVWDNSIPDGNFGVTAPIYLDEISPSGKTDATLAAPTGTPGSSSQGHDVITGSFSSKSEGAPALSTGGNVLNFMGYVAPANTLDASNGNTPGVIDPSNPDAQQVYRAVGEVDRNGKFWVTETNAYSGDNGRAAMFDDATGHYFTAGNSNNGGGPPTPTVPGLIYGTGAQLITPLINDHF